DSVRIAGMCIFDFLDSVATNLMLPLASILLGIFMGWRRPTLLRHELCNYDPAGHRLGGLITAVIRWVAPLLILIVLAAAILK
ncbi:MAG: hypothetical protein K2M12_08175, partial [Muribaculaceae bacterium]|nr:hypothetical protein [Muribaculaceae bacterium]